MGWKPGQGVGPRVTRKQKQLIRKQQANVAKIYGCQLPTVEEENSDESDVDINLNEITFAPDDYKPYVVEPKQNAFGLGYKGMDRRTVLSSNKAEVSKLTVNGKTIRGQVHILNFFTKFFAKFVILVATILPTQLLFPVQIGLSFFFFSVINLFVK